MAVDSRDKRFSVFSLMSPWVPTMPNPDGGFALQADRQHIAYMYRGIAATAPAGSVASLSGLIGMRAYLLGNVGLTPYVVGDSGNNG